MITERFDGVLMEEGVVEARIAAEFERGEVRGQNVVRDEQEHLGRQRRQGHRMRSATSKQRCEYATRTPWKRGMRQKGRNLVRAFVCVCCEIAKAGSACASPASASPLGGSLSVRIPCYKTLI